MFEPVLRFIAASDIHYKVGVDTEVNRFETGIKFAYEYAKTQNYKNIDALYVVGDFANSGSEDEMLLFKSSLDKVVDENTNITLMMASHEYKSGGEEAAHDRFNKIFSQSPDLHNVINGFHFISLTTEKGCRIEEDKQNWLKTELKAAAKDDYKKPIFVFQHPHLSDTVYGSINWGEDDIINILMNYPQIVDFSGHSHAPINDPRSIHQKYFTSCGTGSFSYFELDEFDNYEGTVPHDADNCAQFLIVEADAENRVRIIPVDVLTKQFFNDGYLIEKPYEPESFIYTDERYLTASRPVFSEAPIKECLYNNGYFHAKFSQAYLKNERVDSYRIVLRKKEDGHIILQKSAFSSYYLYEMPENISVDFEIALEKGEYLMELIAKGFWNNYSEKVTETFYVG